MLDLDVFSTCVTLYSSLKQHQGKVVSIVPCSVGHKVLRFGM